MVVQSRTRSSRKNAIQRRAKHTGNILAVLKENWDTVDKFNVITVTMHTTSGKFKGTGNTVTEEGLSG